MRNMLAMLEKYGRLDPADEGVTLKAGQKMKWHRGFWPVLVPSMTDPRKTYQIDYDGVELFCSCPAFRSTSRNGKPCKHLQAFLAENPGLDWRAPAD
jgi:hypothetical protein